MGSPKPLDGFQFLLAQSFHAVGHMLAGQIHFFQNIIHKTIGFNNGKGKRLRRAVPRFLYYRLPSFPELRVFQGRTFFWFWVENEMRPVFQRSHENINEENEENDVQNQKNPPERKENASPGYTAEPLIYAV